MNGMADDVEAEKGRVDGDAEEKIAERLEERALGGWWRSAEQIYVENVKKRKKNQYMQWNGRLYGGCTWR